MEGLPLTGNHWGGILCVHIIFTFKAFKARINLFPSTTRRGVSLSLSLSRVSLFSFLTTRKREEEEKNDHIIHVTLDICLYMYVSE